MYVKINEFLRKDGIMKETKLYTCEICNTSYANKAECKRCEKSHINIKSVKSARYLAYKNNKSGLPISITVEFENGNFGTYKRG